jgi:hypothetical protein
VGSHAFFGDTPSEAASRYHAYMAARELARAARSASSSTLGDAPPSGPLVWQEVYPDSSGDFAIVASGRYAALASASLNYSLSSIVDYLNAHGWQVTYAWEYATPTRDQYPIDTWLASLAADTTSNHRWIYVEANNTGGARTVGQDPPWPLTLYHVAHAFQAVPAPPSSGGGGGAAPNLPSANNPGCPSIPSRVPAFLGGAAVGVVLMLAVHLL